ncbi:MAG: hypothetical protein DME26_15045 [Verrucomicrobia bacterium]|nr:MAG: hypothetical protein DME26_15045 [Verrucomicrobiota bacterium]
MTAKPPATAKSTPLRARSANSFSNREIVAFGSGECSGGIFLDEAKQILNDGKPLAQCRRTPHPFANGLLHWLGLDLHGHKLCFLYGVVNATSPSG